MDGSWLARVRISLKTSACRTNICNIICENPGGGTPLCPQCRCSPPLQPWKVRPARTKSNILALAHAWAIRKGITVSKYIMKIWFFSLTNDNKTTIAIMDQLGWVSTLESNLFNWAFSLKRLFLNVKIPGLQPPFNPARIYGINDNIYWYFMSQLFN